MKIRTIIFVLIYAIMCVSCNNENLGIVDYSSIEIIESDTTVLFYAGRAYEYKEKGGQYPYTRALKDGIDQEFADFIFAPHSAFSYEDLPSDRYGADFGVNHFDPNSDKTLGEQLNNYMVNILKATKPEKAPNYNNLPENDSKNPPSKRNFLPIPIFKNEKP